MEIAMKNTDKFLVGIVVGVVVLVATAFAVALLRPKPTYQLEDTPKGVAHNYLLALQKEDYIRAYGYLSPTIEGYPASAEVFEQNARDYSQNLRLGDTSTMLEVVSARLSGEWAAVTVRETSFYQGGLFDSRQNVNTFEMQLRRDSQSGAWRIIKSGSYWASCWNDKAVCR
jgi:hypothetical protein